MAFGKVVSVTLEARTQGFVAGMRTAKHSVDDLTKAAAPSKADAFDKLSGKAALAGAGIAAGLGVAIKKFADFDSAMSGVAANSGASGAELEKLRGAALKLGADTQFSATEAADGINELAKAGVSSADILGGGLKGSLDLAAAGQIGVGEAAETAATAMTQFNLKGDQIPHVADLMTNAANKAQGGVGDLSQALKQGGLVAASTGLTIDETAASLAAFASAGLIGSDAGTSLKTMLQRLSAPSGKAAQLMDELGISAYDAQGEFVGMEALSGQLRSSLEGLTPAQRNAALATMFGSDAVRAANILYEQGAQGMAKWTDEVTEQGAAAKQAATLNDNLKGDIERLGGALDSAFIKTGSGANGALRTLVQGVTSLVDGIGKVPGPVLLAGGALSSLALMGPKALSGFRDYKANLDALGLSMDAIGQKSPRAAKALGAVAGAAKIGAVVLVGVAALNKLDSSLQAATPSANDLSKALDRVVSSGSIKAFNAEFSQFFEQSAGHKFLFGEVAEDITGVGDALEYLNNKNAAESFGDWKNELLGLSNNTEKAEKAFARADKELTKLFQQDPAAATKVWETFVADARRSGESVESLKKQFPTLVAAMKDADEAARKAGKGNAENAAKMEEAQQAADDLSDSIKGLGDTLLAQEASEDGYFAALRKVNEALEENGATLSKTTEAGRENRAVLRDLVGNTKEWAAAEFEATGNVADSQVVLDKGRKQWIAMRDAMGANETETRRLADQLFKLPKEATTEYKSKGAEKAKADAKGVADGVKSARGRVLDLDASIRTLDGKTVTVEEAGADASQIRVRELDGSLIGLKDKTVQVQEIGTTKAGEMVVQFKDKVYAIPASRTAKIREEGASNARAKVLGLNDSIKLLNGKTVKVGEDGAQNATGKIRTMDGAIFGLKGKTVKVEEIGSNASGDRVVRFRDKIYTVKDRSVDVRANVHGLWDVGALAGSIGGLHDKTVTVTAVTNQITRIFGGRQRWAGGIDGEQPMAAGGVRVHGPGQIKPGIYRTSTAGIHMAEDPKSKWESYIPERMDLRPRATAILSETARRMGYSIEKMAAGGIRGAGVYGNWRKWLLEAQRMSRQNRYRFEDGSRMIRIFEDGSAQWRGYSAPTAEARRVIARLNAAQDRYEEALNARDRQKAAPKQRYTGQHSDYYNRKQAEWTAARKRQQTATRYTGQHSAYYLRKQAEWKRIREEQAAKKAAPKSWAGHAFQRMPVTPHANRTYVAPRRQQAFMQASSSTVSVDSRAIGSAVAAAVGAEMRGWKPMVEIGDRQFFGQMQRTTNNRRGR